MKKVKFFGLAGFILLASGAGFSSCSSDSADPTGGTGVAGQVVKTQFAINIPYGNNSSANQAKKVTRMTDAITQQSGKPFRGISDILLLTFSGDPSSTGNKIATKVHKIGEDNNAYDQDDYRRLYRDIDIPVGTDYMIFYGTAKKANTTSSFTYGKTNNIDTYETETDLTKRNFKLSTITNVDFANHQAANDIIAALNDIAKSSGTDGTNAVAWADVIDSKYDAVTWITKSERDFLKKYYEKFINLSAGSQYSVKAFITKLKSILIGEGTEADLSKKYLTKSIVDNCDAALTKIESLSFPRDLSLPDGVAKIHWNSTNNSFEYYTAGSEVFSTGNIINYNKICYPAELSYFVKTSTMVSDKEMSHVKDFPDYNNWTTDISQAWPIGGTFENAEVSSSTRTVALRDPVQYSVAVLQSTVKCADATLKDNGQSKGGLEQDQDVTVNSVGFPVTGILIGGQPESVDWKYEPTSTETFANTIYDQNMNGTITAGTTASNANYTLVFDNKSTDKKPVFVTIELENNSGMDFYGNDGIILNGAKFYLVGKLDPEATTGTTKPTGVDRVFVQDHITKANFNITNLKGAYNCIPDLRTSGINVGLAVDLSWQDGITFNVDL
ncbi:hypothetical protein F7D73_01365 [Prevotella copri]|uniref:Major fimbrial subunit protein N-terminal domain-containing protein n=1 Tax=Segatella copri TaxID=165179 RepID=A0A6G1TWC3_9BACT|nr:hypothetical protein [Segatella copri]MQN79634.1 hypothetical protein [Segatella copri]